MTCIVAIRGAKEIVVGGDSAESDMWTISCRDDTKFFARGPYIIGFCGSIRIGQIVRFKMKLPKPRAEDLQSKDKMLKFMCSKFIDDLAVALSQNGALVSDDDDGSSMASSSGLIVCVGGYLFCVYPDLAVSTTTKNYIAMGSGESFALGSLYTTENTKQSCTRRVLKALNAASEFSTTVAGPYHLFRSKITSYDLENVSIKRIQTT